MVKYSVQRTYFSYQIFILISTFMCYAGFHMSRKPISIVKSVLHGHCRDVPGKPINWCHWKPFDDSNWSEKLGSLEYVYLLTYASSMFISGHLAERINLRIYLSVGMILSGIMTAVFGFGYFLSIHSFIFYIAVQIVSGIFQATGWPAVVTIMGHWFGKGKRGVIMGIWNSHTSVGNMVGSLIAGIYVNSSWGYSFVIPGLIMVLLGIFVLLFMVPKPQDIGFSSPDSHKKKVEPQLVKCNEVKLEILDTSGQKIPSISVLHNKDDVISIWDALKIPNVVTFAVALFFAKLVAYTFLYWLPNYLNGVGHGLDPKAAGNLSTLFDLGGVFGGILAGYFSDWWITKSAHWSTSNGRSGTCALMLLLAAPMLFIYQKYAVLNSYISFILLFVCGLLVNGPYALITTAVSADLGTKSEKNNQKALATVTAIIDGTGSMGAAFGPFLTGLIVPTGWNNVFVMLIVSDLLALCAVTHIILYNKFVERQTALFTEVNPTSFNSTIIKHRNTVTLVFIVIIFFGSLLFVTQ